MSTQLDDFETRLLHALREEVAHRPGRRRPRSGLLVAAVATAAVVAVAVPALRASPAYSVTKGNADDIRVEINRPEDAAGLERALREHGIRADLTYLSELQTCAPGRYTGVARPLTGLTVSVGSRGVGVSIPAGTVRTGETFVFTWSVLPMTEEELRALDASDVTTVEGQHVSTDVDVAAGPVLPCEPVPVTPRRG